MYQPSKFREYLSARKSLTFFAVITIILILVTIGNAIWCTANFHKGLKPHLVLARKSKDSEKDTEMGTRLPGEGVPGRMMID